jgi:hypothetical protein
VVALPNGAASIFIHPADPGHDLFRDVAQACGWPRGHAATDELRQLEKRVASLEAREELLIERARSAAGVAASSAVTTHLINVATDRGAGSRRSKENRQVADGNHERDPLKDPNQSPGRRGACERVKSGSSPPSPE